LEAARALDYERQSVQIIFNMFRHRPADEFFRRPRAAASAFWRASHSPAACSPASCA
jgi:hypothetical protein